MAGSREKAVVRVWELIRSVDAAEKGITRSELKESIGVDSRTLERDLEVVRSAGFPIQSDGEGDSERFFFVDDAKRVPAIPFSISNLISIYISANLLSFLDGTPYKAGMEDALERIQATLPRSTVKRLDEVKRSFYILKNPTREYSRQAGIIATINEAVVTRRKLSVRYRGPGWKRPRNYVLAPYAVLLFKHALYVAARDEARPDDIRFFAVKRVIASSITKDSFSMPRGFKLDEYMKDAFGIMVEKPRTVKIWFDKNIAPIIEETIWHPSQKTTRRDDGSLVLALQVGGLEEVLWWVLSYGSNARILEPPELVDEMKRTLHQMMGRYL